MMIRTALERDFAGIQTLVRAMDDFHHGQSPDRIKVGADAALSLDTLHAQQRDPQQIMLIVIKDKPVIGYARAQIVAQPEGRAHHARRIAYVHEIAVDPAQRRQGVGKLLFDHIEQWASSNAVDGIELNVYEFNEAALKFYAALGFERLMARLSRSLN